MAVQSLENLHTSILRQPFWWAKECPRPIFSYNIIENSPTSLAYNSVFIGPNNYIKWSYKSYQNLGLIDHNLHDNALSDIICKPPIVHLHTLMIPIIPIMLHRPHTVQHPTKLSCCANRGISCGTHHRLCKEVPPSALQQLVHTFTE